jgi:hypothetical protein
MNSQVKPKQQIVCGKDSACCYKYNKKTETCVQVKPEYSKPVIFYFKFTD